MVKITPFDQNQFMTCYLIFNFRPTYFSYFRKITAYSISHNVRKDVGPNGPIPVVKGLTNKKLSFNLFFGFLNFSYTPRPRPATVFLCKIWKLDILIKNLFIIFSVHLILCEMLRSISVFGHSENNRNSKYLQIFAYALFTLNIP